MTLTNSATLSSKHAPVQLECVPPSGKKYKLLPKEEGEKLHRIVALIDIPEYGVKAGDIGGFIASEANLSHDGKCWVKDDAKVFQDARVVQNAVIFDRAVASGTVSIAELASVGDDVIIRDHCSVFGQSRLRGCVIMKQNSFVYGSASVSGNVSLSGACRIFDRVVISTSKDLRRTFIDGSVTICGDAALYNAAEIYGNSTLIKGSTRLNIGAKIHSQHDFITIGPGLHSGSDLTAYKKLDGTVWFAVDRFDGQIDPLLKMINEKHGEDPESFCHYQKMVKMAALYMDILHNLP